jgi:glycosyltransferase involved in cell wall biosynthesis
VPIIKDPKLPLISVVTPSHNQGQYVRQTVESVLNQTYPNLEYWVIDGESTDNTLRVLSEYERDARFHWISEPDTGQSDAINKGLSRCQGELFMWLNSDDMLLQNALKHVADGRREAGQPALIYGLGRHIDEHGNDLGYCPAQSSTMTLGKLLWAGKHALVQPATFIPTDAVRKVGGLDPSHHYALGLDLWVRLAERIPLKFIPYDIALYRLHRTSKTVTLALEFVDEVRWVLDDAVQRGAISARTARSRGDLFAARTHLMPGTINVAGAISEIWSAVVADPSTVPEALLVLSKAAVRLTVGESLWTLARLAKTKLG